MERAAISPTRFSFVRGLSLPDYMTLANGLAGAGAVLATLGYMAEPRPERLALALALYPLSLAMDFFDGRVARAQRARHARAQTATPAAASGVAPGAFGKELDSLADAVSFAIAPAAVGFAAGLRGGWDALALLFFVACALGRLARYNATSHALEDAGGKVRYFEGLPVTGSLLLVGALAAALATGHVGAAGLPLGAWTLGAFVLHPLALGYVALGCAMVSKRLRVPKP